MKRIIILFACCLWGSKIIAQISSRIDQYYQDFSLINPSAINTGAISTVNLFYNKLFTGVKGSPSDLFASVVIPVPSKRIGFAFNFGQENIGFSRLYNGSASYAYTLPLGESTAFHLGGSIGVISQGFDRDAINVISPSDPIYQSLLNGKTETKFDLKISGTLQINALLLGFSTGRLTQPKYSLDYQIYSNSYALTNISNAFVSTKLQVSNGLILQPVMSLTIFDFKQHNLQYGINFMAKDVIWAGVHSAGNKNIALHIGAFIKQTTKVGYSYSMPVSSESKLLGSGHEIFTSFALNKLSDSRKPLLRDRFVFGNTEYDEYDGNTAVTKKKKVFTDTVTVVSLEGISQLENGYDTSLLKLPSISKTYTTPGYYVVVGVFKSENNVNLHIKNLFGSGIVAYKFYFPENGSYYAFIHRADKEADAEKFKWSGDIDVPAIWTKYVPAK